jgi:hypothetical protein
MEQRTSWPIEFHAATDVPVMPEGEMFPQVVLYNQCDGYHMAFARFWDHGEFDGFYDWCGTKPYIPGKHFAAWAMLPPAGLLYEPFARKTPYVESDPTSGH